MATYRFLEQATDATGAVRLAYVWWTVGDGPRRAVRIEWLS